MVVAFTGIVLNGFDVVLAPRRQCNRGRLLFALVCPLAGTFFRLRGGGNPDFIPRLIVPAQQKSRKAIARYPEGVIACLGWVEVSSDALTKIASRLPPRLEDRQVFHTVWMLPKLRVPRWVENAGYVCPILVYDAARLW